MSVKSQFAKVSGKTAYWYLHNFRSGGTSLPGKLALKIDPSILKDLAKDYEVIIVTGTNGKTMSTSLLVEALKTTYDDVLTNSSGSNMLQGIVTAFLTHKKIPTDKKRLAVLEVDEANVPIITKYLKPKAFALTNLFRDQMDRYGEIYTTYDLITQGLNNAPDAKMIANGDASIFSSRELPNPKIYFGFKTPESDLSADFKAPTNTDGVLCPVCQHIMHYHYITYANLGDFFCPNCGFKRPELTYQVTKINQLTPSSIDFDIEGQTVKLNIGGKYNMYNALLAYSVAKEFGVSDENILESLTKSNRLFGRQELVKIDDKEVNIILVKNPVGLNEVIEILNIEPDNFALATLLNANPADGIDTSWIWDGNFEDLDRQKITDILIGGTRKSDMQLRLKVAGLNHDDEIIVQNNTDLIDQIKKSSAKKIYILTTYTAMLSLRKTLADQKYISAGM